MEEKEEASKRGFDVTTSLENEKKGWSDGCWFDVEFVGRSEFSTATATVLTIIQPTGVVSDGTVMTTELAVEFSLAGCVSLDDVTNFEGGSE
jgi:hypothetical protein